MDEISHGGLDEPLYELSKDLDAQSELDKID